MTQKDYVILARVIGRTLADCRFDSERKGAELLAANIKDACQDDNPRFNVERFRQAIAQAEQEEVMTFEQKRKRDALQAEHTKKLAELAQEELFTSYLSESLRAMNPSIHVYRLYDQAASMKFGFTRYESLRKNPDPTPDTVRELWQAFPAEPVSVYRDGCVGIRTASDAIREAEKRSNTAIVTPIAPVWVEIHPASYDQHVSINWIARVQDSSKINMSVHFPLHSELARALGTLDVRYSYYGGNGPARSVRLNQFIPSNAVNVINDSKAGKLTYGAVEATPGHHVVYWASHNGDHGNVTALDLLAALGV